MGLLTLKASDAHAKPIKWDVDGLIPLGGITLLFGDPGVGKSLFVCRLASTTGIGTNTLICNNEDDWARVLVPRLTAYSAIHGVDFADKVNSGRTLTFPSGCADLEETIITNGYRRVFIDPLFSFADDGVNPANDQQARKMLIPLAEVAKRTDCAIICVGHLVKQDRKALYRVSGAIGVVGQARSVLLMHRGEGNERYLLQVKNNYGPLKEPRKYTIETKDDIPLLIASEVMYGMTNEEVMDPQKQRQPKEGSEVARAKDWIMNEVEKLYNRVPGKGNSKKIYSKWVLTTAFDNAGLSKASLQRAREILNIQSYKEDGLWWWDLSEYIN